MSATAARSPWPVPRAPARDRSRVGVDPALARLAAFAALAAFCAGHWAGLVSGAPVMRTILVLAVATGTAAALTWLGRLELSGPARHAAAAGIVIGAGALALVAMGLPARLLPPGAWDELAEELDRGLSGIRTVEWPYGGDDLWVRLVILLGAPLMLMISAALAFWPVRRGAGLLRALGLIALLAMYGTAVTEHDRGSSLLRGLVLFLLVAAWLWLPRLRPREALPAAVVVLSVGVLALPLAARLDADTAAIDYRSWNWFGGKDVRFDWNHSYGPLDWPREGTTLLQVEADRALYWKAEVLDHFDGLRWMRSDANDRTSPRGELPLSEDRRWDERLTVTVRSLRTDFLVAAGTPKLVTGAGEAVSGSADGTLRSLEEPLRRGDSYTVNAYVPDPSPREMRAAQGAYEPTLSNTRRSSCRRPARTPCTPRDPAQDEAEGPRVTIPLVGGRARDRAAERALAESPYARTYRLARRLTAGAPTTFDAVRRVQDHLRREFTYSERPPSREYPLDAFLFEDKLGYCQQFSGAMALMLRMAGVPARVVSGFSPGSLNRDTGEFRVRDLDAHSWVEVAFPGIGWVTFDPTPPAAPADRAGQGLGALDRERGGAGATSSGGGTGPQSDRSTDSTGQAGADGGGGSALLAVLIVAVLASAIGFGLWRRRVAGERSATGDEAGLRELERALPRLGWALPPRTTLLELERRLARAAGPASAGYIARLRAGRFSAAGTAAPPRSERRALRRELTAGRRGPLARLRGYLALPPGGPAGRRPASH